MSPNTKITVTAVTMVTTASGITTTTVVTGGAGTTKANMAKDVEEAVRPLQTIPEMTPTSTIATDYRRRMTVAMVTTEEAAQAAMTDEKATPGLK